jgi:hypothetical protein
MHICKPGNDDPGNDWLFSNPLLILDPMKINPTRADLLYQIHNFMTIMEEIF